MNFLKSILVAGAGKSGIYAAKLLLSKGAEVILFDEDPKDKVNTQDVLNNFSEKSKVSIYLKELPIDILENVEYMVLSPGISFEAPFTEIIRAHNIPIYSEIELAYRMSESRQIAAITGTNGKTTTTSLVGDILKKFNDSTYVVGNIGIPYTMVADKIDADSLVVAEISSFQLETIDTFRPRVSAILNVTPDHLDRHHTMEIYADTKMKIAMNQTSDEVVILNYDDEITREMANNLNAKVVYFSRLTNLDEGIYLDNGVVTLKDGDGEYAFFKPEDLKLLGVHNLENVMAAVGIAYYMGVEIDIIKKICMEFAGVEHRIEYVGTVNDVTYYNDSKGTNPDAAIKAVEAMIRPTILIGGGYDKKAPFDEWVKSFEGKVKSIVLIGDTAKDIADTCDRYGFENYVLADTFNEAIDKCYEMAIPGDAVLLSPACASWGMFDNYEQRGDMFKEHVSKLGE